VVTLLAEGGGALAGYAQLGWDPASPSVGGARPVQIRRFYVDSAWHGRGLAQRLMTRSLEIAAEGGADRVWLGVWERNDRGIAFYRKVGFEPCGEQTFVLGGDPQRDLVLARDVGPPDD
jgi:ribosomal protein S18 acetylase RimI-like enzyme